MYSKINVKIMKKTNKYVSVMEIAPKQVENTQGKCICEDCKNTFDPKDTLMEKCNNLSFMGLLGIKGITKGKNTWYLVSPCCKTTHLYGFDVK